MPAGLVIPTVFTAINRFTAPVRAMASSMRGFAMSAQVGLANLERGFRRVMSPLESFQNTLRGIGLYVGLFSLIMLMRSAIGVFADFEQAQINIASVAEKNSLPYLKSLSNEARKVALNYGQSAAAISDFQFELIKMGYSAQEAMKMTEPITTGAVALRTTPNRLQEVVGAVLKSHDMQAGDTRRVVNQIAYVSNATAAQFEDLATMLPIINRLSHKMNIPFETSLAVLGTLRDVQIHTSTGSTSFKNILLDLKAQSWDDLKKGVMKVSSAKNATLYAYNKFGKRSVVSAIEIADSLKKIEDLAKNTKNVADNYTSQLAGKQLLSVHGRVKLFKSAYEELILSIDEGNGPAGTAIKRYLEIGSAMLMISSGSEAARERLAGMNYEVKASAERYLSWLKVAFYIVSVLVAIKVAIILLNAVLFIGKVFWWAYSGALALAAAAGWVNVTSLRGNAAALYLLRGILSVVTAAQWLWNAALAANPIGLVIIAIAAMLGWVYLCVKAYDTWGAAGTLLMSSFGTMISFLVQIRDHWKNITAAFKGNGFIAGIFEIGKAISDAILTPIRQVYELINKVTGFKWAANMAARIGNVQDVVNSRVPQQQPKELVNAKEESQQDMMQKMFSSWSGSIDINNKTGFPASAKSNNGGVKFSMGSTFFDYQQ